MARFDGRVVVVTGAASGLGEATSARLLSEGATVIGADINEPSSSPPASGGKWFPAFTPIRHASSHRPALFESPHPTPGEYCSTS